MEGPRCFWLLSQTGTLRPCLSGDSPPLRSEIDEQVEFLGLRIADDPSMAVIYLVERFLDPEASGERSRRLALYAVRSVVEELLAALAPLTVFQDEHDNIVAITLSPGSAFVQAIAEIESRVSQSLAHGVIVASKHVAGGLAGVPEAYETLAAEIARKASFGSFVVLAQGYIDARYADPDLSLVDGEEVELAIRALAVSDETAAAQGVEAALEDQDHAFRHPCLGAVLPSRQTWK